MQIDLRSRTEVFAFYTGRYDTDLIAAAVDLLPPGGVALDVGANVGFWAVPLAQKGLVHAFEPVPSNADRLRDNTRRNRAEANLVVHELALSDRAGSVQITLREDFARGAGTGNAAIYIGGFDDQFATVTIATDTLDSLAPRLSLDRLHVLKVDIEGHEDLFLSGAKATLGRFRPVIFVEWNRHYYDERKIDATMAFHDALAGMTYAYLRRDDDQWRQVSGFSSTRDIDDLVLVPKERVGEVLSVLGSR